MDKIIDEAAKRGILIMLDLHSFNVLITRPGRTIECWPEASHVSILRALAGQFLVGRSVVQLGQP
jgi:hypothetical protein